MCRVSCVDVYVRCALCALCVLVVLKESGCGPEGPYLPED